MRNTLFLLVAGALFVSLTAASSSEELSAESPQDTTIALLDADGEQIDQETVRYYVDVRTSLGLSGSATDIQSALDQFGVEPEWGFPMTPAELEKVERHRAIQEQMPEDVILGFRDIPGYAGFYFDHLNDGAPTLMVTEPEAVRAIALDPTPAEFKDLLVLVQAEHTWDELVAAAQAAAHLDDENLDELVHRVAIKTESNQLEVSVADATDAAVVRAELQRILAVPFSVTVEPVSEPEVCTGRTNCHTPMKAGIEVKGGNSILVQPLDDIDRVDG